MNKLDATITLEFLEEHNACQEGIEYFEAEIGNPISARALIDKLLREDGFEKIKWVNWLLTRLFDRTQTIHYAIFAAELVLPIFESKYPNDARPRTAIEAAKKVVLNDTAKNIRIASNANNAADDAAYAAANAANSANSANAATYAARAYAAAYAAASAAYAAANAACATYATYAAASAAYAAANAATKKMLKKIINYGIKLLTDEN